MLIDSLTYTTRPGAASSSRYIEVYTQDGTYVSRHNSIEEATESASAYAQENLPEGDHIFVFRTPNKEMTVRLLDPATGGQGTGQTDVTPPSAPVNGFLSDYQLTSIRVNWTYGGEPDIQTGRIYKSTTSSTTGFSLIDSVGYPTAFVIDSTYNPLVQSWYRVTAVDNAGNESNFSTTFTDITAPSAPSAPTVGSFGSTNINITLPTSTANDHSSFQVWAQANAGGYTQHGSTSSATYNVTSLTPSTTYDIRLRDVDVSGNVSVDGASVQQVTAAASSELYDLTAGATRTPPTWATDGTFQWAAVPVTTTTFNVPADGPLNTAVSVAGRLVIVAAGYTYTGSITVSVSDIDIVMADTATITGALNLGNGGVRQRVTGGNVNAGIDINGASGRATSIIIENVSIEYDSTAGYGIETSGNYERLAILNNTIHDNNPAGQESSGWNIFGNYTSGPTDLIVAGNLLDHVAGSQAQTIRIQGLDRYIFIDNAVIGRSSGAGTYGSAFRGLGNNYVWIADCLMRGSWALDGSIVHPSGTRAYGTQNATWERIDSRANSAVFFGDVGSSTGTFNNSTRYTFSGTPTSEVNISPFTGSNNPAVSWDGVTLPSLAGYGADHA